MINTAVFFDIDGTLRDIGTSAVPQSAGRAIKKLRGAGYKLGIASGRAIGEIGDEILSLIDWDVIVCSNGQSIHKKGGGRIRDIFFPEDVVAKCLSIAEKAGTTLQLVPCDARPYLTGEPNDDAISSYAVFNIDVPPVKQYQGEKIEMIMVFGESEEDYSEYKKISGISVCVGIGRYADISIEGVSKYTGILDAMEYLGVSKYIAFGDAMNDFEMLKNADISVAMGSAPEELVAVAGYQTSAVMDDGIERSCEALKLY